MKKLPTWERVNELFSYDEDTGHLIRKCDVYSGKGNGRITARAGERAGSFCKRCLYRFVKIDGVDIREHRLIWFLKTRQWPKHEIDHINMVRRDNRWCNLREATHAENSKNVRAYRNNRSGIKGICWREDRQKWHAQIDVRGKHIHLGTFDCAFDAMTAYQLCAYEFHGEYARIEEQSHTLQIASELYPNILQ